MAESMHDIVNRINKDMLVHCMYDGFWVHSWKQKTLIISGSHDSIYMRDIDLVFKKVTFFNVPESWRDTQIKGNEMIRLATEEEFHKYHPDFAVNDRFIFAIDIWFYYSDPSIKFTFFIIAEHIYLNLCDDHDPVPKYIDSCPDEQYPCMYNRVSDP